MLFAVAVNDLADERIDRVNLPTDARRPLVAGTGTRVEMIIVASTAAVLALGASFLLHWPAPLIVGGGLVFTAAYSLRPVRIADRGVVAPMLLPAGYVAVPYLLGIFAVRGSVTRTDLLLLAGLYSGFIGRIVLKDFRDVRGDALFGKRTFLVRHGRRATCGFSAAFLVFGVSVLPFVRRPSVALVAAYAVFLAITLGLLWTLARSTKRAPRFGVDRRDRDLRPGHARDALRALRDARGPLALAAASAMIGALAVVITGTALRRAAHRRDHRHLRAACVRRRAQRWARFPKRANWNTHGRRASSTTHVVVVGCGRNFGVSGARGRVPAETPLVHVIDQQPRSDHARDRDQSDDDDPLPHHVMPLPLHVPGKQRFQLTDRPYFGREGRSHASVRKGLRHRFTHALLTRCVEPMFQHAEASASPECSSMSPEGAMAGLADYSSHGVRLP